MSAEQQQLVIDLIALIKKVQPSIVSKGNKVVIKNQGQEVSIDQFRTSTIAEKTARFR